MNSNVIFKERQGKQSHLITAFEKMTEKINTKVEGQYSQNVIIQSGNITIKNSDLDCEFTIPFDDDTEANEAEITIYNLTNETINNIKNHGNITVTAGYGTDTGIIFSGFVAKKNVKIEDCDKVITINAVDDMSRQEKNIESLTYAAGTKASKILKDLVSRISLPVAVFTVSRDHTYTDEETIDGDIFDNVKRLASICGVSAYILKGKIYVRPLKQGDNTTFTLSVDTGLLSLSPFETEEKNADYTDIVKGYDIEMLLQHRIQTASIITIKSRDVNGKFRVKSGSHTYDGSKFITKVKAVQC